MQRRLLEAIARWACARVGLVPVPAHVDALREKAYHLTANGANQMMPVYRAAIAVTRDGQQRNRSAWRRLRRAVRAAS